MNLSILFTLIFLVSFNISGQTSISEDTERKIAEAIKKKARCTLGDNYPPEKEGATWLLLKKVNDSVLIKTLYVSSEEFDQSKVKEFSPTINKEIKDLMNTGQNIIVRVRFKQLEGTNKLFLRENEKIEERIADNKIRNPHIILAPIVINIYH